MTGFAEVGKTAAACATDAPARPFAGFEGLLLAQGVHNGLDEQMQRGRMSEVLGCSSTARKGIRAHVASAEIAEFYLGCPIRQPPDLPEQPDLAFFGP